MPSKNKTPKALYNSGLVREKLDKYWTEHWCTETLVRHLAEFGVTPGKFGIWEPCAGRGDIVHVLQAAKFKVYASDIKPEPDFPCDQGNLLDDMTWDVLPSKVDGVKLRGLITNTPYGREAEKCVRKVLGAESPLEFAAFILRTTWKAAGEKRAEAIFRNPPNGWNYAGEIVLTKRPMWDWWIDKTPEEKEEENGAFHPFSWYIFSKNWDTASIQIFDQ